MHVIFNQYAVIFLPRFSPDFLIMPAPLDDAQPSVVAHVRGRTVTPHHRFVPHHPITFASLTHRPNQRPLGHSFCARRELKN